MKQRIVITVALVCLAFGVIMQLHMSQRQSRAATQYHRYTGIAVNNYPHGDPVRDAYIRSTLSVMDDSMRRLEEPAASASPAERELAEKRLVSELRHQRSAMKRMLLLH